MTFALTRAQFEQDKAKVAQYVAGPVKDADTFQARGITLKYSYVDAPLSSSPNIILYGTLTVDVIDYGGHWHALVDHAIRGWFAAS